MTKTVRYETLDYQLPDGVQPPASGWVACSPYENSEEAVTRHLIRVIGIDGMDVLVCYPYMSRDPQPTSDMWIRVEVIAG